MKNSVPTSKLAAAYFILTALAFYIIAKFFPEKLGDLSVAFFGASLGGFLGIAYALHLYRKPTDDAKATELRSIEQAKQAELRAQQQRQINHIRWLSGILKQVLNYVTNQADEIESFVKEIQKEPSEIHQLGIIANSSIKRLTRADNEATFHAYNTIFSQDPEKDKHYGELLGITDFIATRVAQVLKNFDGYLKNLYERKLRIKAMLEQAANDLVTLKSSMDFGGSQANHNGSVLHEEANRYLLIYTSLVVRSRPMKELVGDFVNPILRILVKEPHFPGSNELTMKLKDINVAFTDLKRESEHIQQAFDHNKLREPAGRLTTVRDRLKNGIRSAETIINTLP